MCSLNPNWANVGCWAAIEDSPTIRGTPAWEVAAA
jgi:hypothetical protein